MQAVTLMQPLKPPPQPRRRWGRGLTAVMVSVAAHLLVVAGLVWQKYEAPKPQGVGPITVALIEGPPKIEPPTPPKPPEPKPAKPTPAKAAKAHHKLLLVDFGGNWCPDCLMLAGIMEDPAAKAFVDAHYEVVLVDVGRFDENLAIPARYGIAKVTAVPAIVVVAPDGKILNRGKQFALSDANSMDPQAVLDQLAAWAR